MRSHFRKLSQFLFCGHGHGLLLTQELQDVEFQTHSADKNITPAPLEGLFLKFPPRPQWKRNRDGNPSDNQTDMDSDGAVSMLHNNPSCLPNIIFNFVRELLWIRGCDNDLDLRRNEEKTKHFGTRRAH